MLLRVPRAHVQEFWLVVQMSTPGGRLNADMSVTWGTRWQNPHELTERRLVRDGTLEPGRELRARDVPAQVHRSAHPVGGHTALYGRCLVCRLTARHSFSQTLACRSAASSSPTPGSDRVGSGLASVEANWMYTDMDGLGCCARPPPPGRLALPPPLPLPPLAAEYPSRTDGGASRGRTPSILPPSPRYNAATGMSMEPGSAGSWTCPRRRRRGRRFARRAPRFVEERNRHHVLAPLQRGGGEIPAGAGTGAGATPATRRAAVREASAQSLALEGHLHEGVELTRRDERGAAPYPSP